MMWNNERTNSDSHNDLKENDISYEPVGVMHGSDGGLNGDDFLSDDEVLLNQGVEEVEDDSKFLEGDHVFIWQGFSQRHGIILQSPHGRSGMMSSNSLLDDAEDDMRDEEQLISVVTFYERIPQANPNRSHRFSFNIRRDAAVDDLADERPMDHNGSKTHLKIKQVTLKQFKGNARKVHKVRYGATKARRVLSRPGTCTCIEPDERGLVMARLRHILEYAEDFLPDFKRLSANDECAAVWCRTGRWVTLQGASMLHIISASHVGSAMVAAGVVSQMTVTYVMPWVPGYVLVWSVPATVAFPFLIPVLVGYGLTSLVPLEILRRHRRRWKQISAQLNRDFWAKATDDFKMEYFSKCATNEEGFLSNFFGTTAEEKAAEDKNNARNNSAGQYMPVNLATDDDDSSDDDEDEHEIQNKCNKFAASFDDSASAEVASGGRQQGNPLGSLVRRLRTSFANINNRSSDNLNNNIDRTECTNEAFLQSHPTVSQEKKTTYCDEDQHTSAQPLI